jgi:hypothetical protein
MKKLISIFLCLFLTLFACNAYAVKLSGGIRLGYHAYTANEFLDGLQDLDQSAFNSPSNDQPLPPLELEFNAGFLDYFSVSGLLGTFTGKAYNSLNIYSSTQTIYTMVMPRFDYSFSFNLKDGLPITIDPYFGVGVGASWFAFWQDPTYTMFPPLSAVDENHVVFTYSPSIGLSVPLLRANPDLDEVLPPELEPYKARLKLLLDYRYLQAKYHTFNAGGHLFLFGLGMDF